MGLYGRGFDPARVDTAAIAEEMRPSLEQWFDARIRVEDPRTLQEGAYDPVADTGGESTPLVLFEADALVQALNTATVGDYAGQATSLLVMRVQVAVPAEVELRAGLHIVVTDGGNDPSLTRRHIMLDRFETSSLAWLSILTGRVIQT